MMQILTKYETAKLLDDEVCKCDECDGTGFIERSQNVIDGWTQVSRMDCEACDATGCVLDVWLEPIDNLVELPSGKIAHRDDVEAGNSGSGFDVLTVSSGSPKPPSWA